MQGQFSFKILFISYSIFILLYILIANLVYASLDYDNAANVERSLQEHLEYLDVGERLWKYPAMGGYTMVQKYRSNKTWKVFITHINQSKLSVIYCYCLYIIFLYLILLYVCSDISG